MNVCRFFRTNQQNMCLNSNIFKFKNQDKRNEVQNECTYFWTNQQSICFNSNYLKFQNRYKRKYISEWLHLNSFRQINEIYLYEFE